MMFGIILHLAVFYLNGSIEAMAYTLWNIVGANLVCSHSLSHLFLDISYLNNKFLIVIKLHLHEDTWYNFCKIGTTNYIMKSAIYTKVFDKSMVCMQIWKKSWHDPNLIHIFSSTKQFQSLFTFRVLCCCVLSDLSILLAQNTNRWERALSCM